MTNNALFDGMTVIIVGGGRGLGREYAIQLAAAGANVAVVARSGSASDVVDEITATGGRAVAICCDLVEGDRIVSATLAAFGSVDAIVVNAGNLRDRSFAKMTQAEWDDVLGVHLDGSFACTKAIWPHFVERGGGAILLTTSGAGMHGAFGQTNYAAAKAGIIGLMRNLSLEGARAGIRVNAIAPMASTAMTRDIFPEELNAALTARDVAPFALAMIHPSCDATGQVIEAGGGWAAAMRWERSAGLRLDPPDLQAVLTRWREITDFSNGSDLPKTTADSLGAAAGLERTMRAGNLEQESHG